MNTYGLTFGPSDSYHRRRAREMRQQMTLAESELWKRLKANRLEHLHFRRQQVIDGYIVDFYCHEAGLVIEVDGEVHNERYRRDELRDRKLTRRGLLVLRFLNEEIFGRMEWVLEEITNAAKMRRRMLAERGAQGQ